MSPESKVNKRLRPVYTLRDRKGFDHFIGSNELSVILVYHYICPGCEIFLKKFKKLAAEYQNVGNLSFGKIHMQLRWMIEQAELVGDIKEENVFLKKYDVGGKVPATMFFRSGELVWKIEGVLEPPVFRGLVKKLRDETPVSDEKN